MGNLANSKVIVFTGAGATAGLGFPTTPQFINTLRNKWPTTDHLVTLFREQRGKAELDSEEFRDWLSDLADSAEVISAIGRQPPFKISIGNPGETGKYMSSILSGFDKLIRDSYGLVDSTKAFHHFRPLFEVFLKHHFGSIPLFTTNYDLAIECLSECHQCNWKVVTGMAVKGPRTLLDTTLFRDNGQSSTIFLYKIHGSTDWWFNPDTKQVEHASLSYTPPDNYKDVLIYPTRDKFERIKEQPFSFFYDSLANYLSSTETLLAIVIGYSFRDKFINEQFIKAIQRGLKVVLIDPNPNLKQLLDGLGDSSLRVRIKTITIPFGNWSEKYQMRFNEAMNNELQAISSFF